MILPVVKLRNFSMAHGVLRKFQGYPTAPAGS